MTHKTDFKFSFLYYIAVLLLRASIVVFSKVAAVREYAFRLIGKQ